MKKSRLTKGGFTVAFLILPTFSHAITTLVSPSVYSVSESVDFTIGNSGSSSFLLNWTDPTGNPALSFSGITDPTLVLTLGQTYTFQRISTAHPFAIMDNSAAAFIDGTDGSYFRTTTDSAVITSAILEPNDQFIANPGTPGNLITWTPDQLGDFWYTCTVTSHTGMAGLISVVPEPSAFGLITGVFALTALGSRRGCRSRRD